MSTAPPFSEETLVISSSSSSSAAPETPDALVAVADSSSMTIHQDRLWILMTYQNLEAAYRLWSSTIDPHFVNPVSSVALLNTWSFMTMTALDAATPLTPTAPTCPICLTHPLNRVIIPCGHTLCDACSPHVHTCMLCRGSVDSIHPFFL